ncbi:MAG: agmatine deiminase family protein [Kiritimatiellia bacterium]
MRALDLIGGSAAGLVLAICLSGLVVPRSAKSRALPVSGATLISDAHGALAEICIQYRQDFNPLVIETLSDLLQGLASDVDVRVIVASKKEFDFLKGELARRHVARLGRLSAVVTGFPITPWARDRFGAMVAENRTVLAVPPARSNLPGPRGNDERVPEILAASLSDATCLSLPFMFEGGDLLADEEHAFLSANCLARNSPDNIDDRPGLLRRMQGALHKPIVVIGETAEDVPDHHICMFLTPLGDKTVAVADPALGLALYQQSPSGEAVDVETDTTKYEPFQNVLRCMEQQGYQVMHVPLLLTRTPRVYVSYNNVMLERRNGEKRVYMPVYGVPALDRAAGEVFATQGWRVIPVRVGKLYQQTGSLRCQVGIIRRR